MNSGRFVMYPAAAAAAGTWAGATNVFPGAADSVSWAIVHGPIVLAIHAALGLAILVGAIHNFFWNIRWGTRGPVPPWSLSWRPV
jgi:hypothetical protein